MSGIGGNEPTRYNYAAADTLKSNAETLASQLDGQRGSRSSLVTQAMADFRGYYSEVFDNNADVASRSSQQLASSLRSMAGFVTELKEAAEAEDQRREEARAWEERQREREENWFKAAGHEVTTWFGGGDDPKPPEPEPEPQLTAEEVNVQGRDIAAPAGGSSTSSAVPDDLRSFQTGISGLDDELTGAFSNFESALSAYESYCNGRWGTLSAQSLVTAVRDWLDANAQDADWAGEVAGAFEAAGGSGVITVADASISAALASAGVGVHRDDFTIEPFSAIGTPPTTGFADDPVNTATGNFLEPEHDLQFAGAAASLAMTRMYNSLDDRTGIFGLGWSSILDTRLELDDEGASFVMADGRQIDFPRAGAGWDRGVGENYWLEELPASAFTSRGVTVSIDRVLQVTDNAGAWWAFSPAGTWLGAGHGPGSTVSVIRDDAGHITRLLHERGRFIDIEYIDDRVASVHASDGRRVEYFYNELRRLTGVTDSVGTRTYRWNDADLIDQVVAADGVVEAENFYDANGRVIRQLTPYGRSVRFAYLRGRVTSVSTDDGTGANTWISDRKGRVVGIIDADGKRQSMAYDPHGNIVSATDRDGQVTVHVYDDRGRKTRTVTPEGADLTYGFDQFDRVTTVVTASGGVVEYGYATNLDRDPSVIVDPEGGRTELVWDNGLLTQVVDPEGVHLSFGYDSHGDLIGVTNAAGDTAKMLRDHAGRVVEARTPLGARTQYRYDERGLLTSREDPDGGIWRFEYGAGGKATAIIDPLKARTELEYGAHGELVTTTDPLGRKITKDFDEFGNVAKVALPDGAEWAFTHDALSRLREIIDPAGGVWSRDYDANGQLAATVDPTGVRVDATRSRADGVATVRNAFEHTTVNADEYGRPVGVTQADGAEELVSYDACGRPVEFVDAEGGLTKIERDLAGRIIGLTTPAGRTTRYEYDACGRPLAATDHLGARTTLTYDADSRVIARTNPVGDVTSIDYDVAGRVIRQVVPGGGVARYRYDKLGRLIGAQDSRYGQRKFGYDAAGQLVQVTNGVGGVTRYQYDERGRMVKTIDPTGGVTTRTYTHIDNVASSTDPLGRTTTAIYDTAGRQTSQTDPDGNVTEWTHDEAGRESGMKINARWIVKIAHDEQARTATVTDCTRDDHKVTHTLTYNRLGQITDRATVLNGRIRRTQWEYDADGGRISLVDDSGARIVYQRDMAGRVTQITHQTLGEIDLDYDAAGHLRQTRAGDQIQTWEYADGVPVEHTRTDTSGVSSIEIIRDNHQRIIGLSGPDGITNYRYDDACQLTAVAGPTDTKTWAYDLGGRLIHETGPTGQRDLRYDAAGQLVTVTEANGAVSEYHYDGQGRRIRATSADRVTQYSWDARGWLAQISEHDATEKHETNLWVNALGELAHVDGTELRWDIAAGFPSLIGVDGTPVFQGPAGLTGLADQWEASRWRSARATDSHDPWTALAAAAQRGDSLPGGLGLSADGGVKIAGLEWMGARVYDSGVRGFLSVDPLAPPTGAGWSANPYSYAGNDPLHAVDPLGLSPVSDAELQSYADGLQGPLANAAGAVGNWWSNNWEYVAAGAAVVGGVAVMATGVGGPLGAAMISGALVSGGLSTGTQKHFNGSVDWAAVGKETVVGGLMGGLGAGASNVTSSLLLKQSSTARAAVTTHAGRGSVSAANNGAMSMLNGNTKLAAAAKLEAKTNSGMLVDNFARDLAGDTVSTMTTANAGYLTNVVSDPDTEFSVEGLVAANGDGLFRSTVSGTLKSGVGGFTLSSQMSSTSTGPGPGSQFALDYGTATATDSLANFIDWEMQDHVHGGVTAKDRTQDTLESGVSNLGAGLHRNAPNLHIGQGGN